MIVGGPWIYRDTGAGFAWCPPPNCSAAIDLRPTAACAQVGGAAQGIGLFNLAADPGAGYVVLGNNFTDTVTAARITRLATALGLPSLDSTTVRDLIWEVLTVKSDPTGVRAALPIMPTPAGRLELRVGAFLDSHTLNIGDPEWAKVQTVYQGIYRAVRAAVIAGTLPANLHRKMLTFFLRTMRTQDPSVFIPNDLPLETPITPTTTITDDFNRANGAIGTSSEGWSWNALVGTWDVNSGLGRNTGGAEANVRAESDLSSSDHYASLKFWSGVGTFWGIAARFSGSASTFYTGFCNVSGSDFRLSKLVGGARTDLTTTASGGALTQGDILKITVAGSSLVFAINGVTKLSTTDSSIASGTRTGSWAYAVATAAFDDFIAADNAAGSTYTLSAAGGSYSYTGTAAALRATRELPAAGGTYALTGTAAQLRRGYTLTAASGSYAQAGTPTVLRVARTLSAAGGTYAQVGAAAVLRAARRLPAGSGNYTYDGTSAQLRYSGAAATYTLTAAGGAYGLTGSPATLRYARLMTVAGGSYSYAGTPAALRAARVLHGDPGTYGLSGTNAALAYGQSGASAREPITTTFQIHRLVTATMQIRRLVEGRVIVAPVDDGDIHAG